MASIHMDTIRTIHKKLDQSNQTYSVILSYLDWPIQYLVQ